MTVTSTGDPGRSPAAVQKRDDLVSLTIDDVELSVPKNTLVIRAAELIGVQVPRFCDHPLLDPVGACRQCLVEVPDAGNGRPMPKPQASCTLTVAPGMVVRTQASSPVADKAQQGIMEFLLVNHPLDCPVCDKGGECPLQNQAMSNGRGETRFADVKRTFEKPINISAQVLLDRERCVLCARCTRFSQQIAGDPFIEMIDRGVLQQVGIYEHQPFESYFSGNTIQICPVGALTSAGYRFRSRPFDLVSTPSVAEHDACGAAIRVDHRRGKVMRRLAGDDPEVNEEWISDKDRFAFTYACQDDRLTRPLVREASTGELQPASWPAAFAAAAAGLAHAARQGRVGVLTGGRLTREDSYAYQKFARAVLGTNNVDFRARRHSAEEADFLAAHVAGSGLGVTYADLERARTVVLAGLDPEEEAAMIFLRLRKAVRKQGVRVFALASHTSRGLSKLSATVLATVPGDEAAALAGLADDGDVALDAGGVLLVGERLATTPGAYSAAAALARRTGARLAWIPRRAGDRGAVDAGCLPGLLPGARPVAEASARADVAAAWGVGALPSVAGLDTDAIIDAAAHGRLGALVVAGVDPADLSDPAAARTALESVPFLVSMEIRASDVTRRADVVLPVAPTVEKAGTFVDWEGRPRPFDQVLTGGHALPDVRVLAGIAESMPGSTRGLGVRTVDQARAELDELADWDGHRVASPAVEPAPAAVPGAGEVVLDTWKLLIDDGRMLDGEPYLHATARPATVRLSASTLHRLGVVEGGQVTLRTDRGAVTLPAETADIGDDVAWTPQHSGAVPLRLALGAGAGDVVRVGAGHGASGGPR